MLTLVNDRPVSQSDRNQNIHSLNQLLHHLYPQSCFARFAWESHTPRIANRISGSAGARHNTSLFQPQPNSHSARLPEASTS